MSQERLNELNSEFWSEPCGTNAAINLNLQTTSYEDISKFDSWYSEMYPYLFKYLDSLNIANMSVLEIGVGYGTVSRYLAKRARQLTLLDIAPGALNFVAASLSAHSNIHFLCKNILEFSTSEKYDLVVAIGSLHHTGNLEKALNNVEELLVPNGQILVMVYFAFQPRRWVMHPFRTFLELLKTFKYLGNQTLVFTENDKKLRAKADVNQAGEAAPYTAFSSRKLFMNRNHIEYDVTLNNFHRVPFLSRLIPRDFFLKYFANLGGCDIYALGLKKID